MLLLHLLMNYLVGKLKQLKFLFMLNALRGRQMVSHRPHNPEIAGSIPAPAINFENDSFTWTDENGTWFEDKTKESNIYKN